MDSLVSIIIPIYNASKTISDTIESVLNGTYVNFEIIAVDDCSYDGSFEILKTFEKKDNRVHVYRNEVNKGVSDTRNYALTLSKGEIICFLDSDDLWKKEKLECQVEFLKKNDADILYSAYEMIDEKGNVIKPFKKVPEVIDYKSLLKENVILCSTVMIKKSILPQNPFGREYFHEDFVLWLYLLKKNYKAYGINQNLVSYRAGGRSKDKINAAKHRWVIYRKSERISVFKSICIFFSYAVKGIKKYYSRME